MMLMVLESVKVKLYKLFLHIHCITTALDHANTLA